MQLKVSNRIRYVGQGSGLGSRVYFGFWVKLRVRVMVRVTFRERIRVHCINGRKILQHKLLPGCRPYIFGFPSFSQEFS